MSNRAAWVLRAVGGVLGRRRRARLWGEVDRRRRAYLGALADVIAEG